MNTRSQDNVYLIGSYVSEILGAKLPSVRQTFGYFLYLHKEQKLTIRDACSGVIQSVADVWAKASIPIRASQHSIKKLERTFCEWTALQKHKNRATKKHKEREAQFVANLENLFDIAHADALNIISNPDDKAFLTSQREQGRPGLIGSVDMVHDKKMKRKQHRVELEAKRRKKCLDELEASSSKIEPESVELPAFSDSSDSDDNLSQEPTDGFVSHPVKKRATKNVVTPGLAAALDRTQTSSRNATYVLSELASGLGHDVSDLNINRTSIQRARSTHRANAAHVIKSEFDASVPLTVHWDGKLMEDLTTNEHVDRLPVLVSGVGVEKLLGVPKLSSSTGVAQADAVVGCLEDWNITEQVVALSFDTTASNTGHRSGACSRIEQKLDKDLLHLPCRHHIMELVIGTAFDKMMGCSSGPEIQIFKRFGKQWKHINQDQFEPASTDTSVESEIVESRNDLVDFIQAQLMGAHPRDDYSEFLELALIFLGGTPVRGIHFRVPGAMHRARWMAKVIYAIKMWLFRGQFKITKGELKGIRDVVVFAVKTYMKAWFTAPNAVEAPLNDFSLMADLLEYPHKAMSEATSHKLGLHLWYIS
jgi:hypothetical protein